jgi:hypothetical protein
MGLLILTVCRCKRPCHQSQITGAYLASTQDSCIKHCEFCTRNMTSLSDLKVSSRNSHEVMPSVGEGVVGAATLRKGQGQPSYSRPSHLGK